jgi:hypothetical protein
MMPRVLLISLFLLHLMLQVNGQADWTGSGTILDAMGPGGGLYSYSAYSASRSPQYNPYPYYYGRR